MSNCNQEIERIVELDCHKNPFHPKCKNTIVHKPSTGNGEKVYQTTVATNIDLSTRLGEMISYNYKICILKLFV